ncbi:acyltransferase family protein [Brachybacterium sp. FME24]|uniref:acyltransferase family protein n=1 Tax=Brachybacterium sp. FME24 TaxID=2742605 RepID=UPI002714AD57|nr:acyltransferase family protein [Brachybacterium sp. FME24]
MTAEPASASTHAGRFRPELHGLRGLAIGLVVLYHVWFDRVSGGVDVFLFLSSFLLVGTFVRRLDRGDAMRPLAYWARTFKRLLPPTAVVALATLAGVYLILPPDRWVPAIHDAIGSLLHVENWVLVQRGVDYYAADDSAASAFQHFWSLSIQGQIFLVWPLLIAAAVLTARRLRRAPQSVLAVVFGAVLLLSFGWSIYSTATQQEIAYFDTFARAWEFAAGSLLGLALPAWEERRDARRGRHHRRAAAPPSVSVLRMVAGWTGIVGLISCGLLVDVQGAFPGWIAAWPLAAAALVLASGTTGHRFGVDRVLATRPARILGDLSYGLYLVHWPLLALYLAHAGKDRAGLVDGLVLILLALVLAWLLTRLVDTPVRRWRWAGARTWRSGLVALSALVLGLSPVVGAQQHLLSEQREAQMRAIADNPGARVLDPEFAPHPDADPSAELLPTAAAVGSDWVYGDEECSGDLAPAGEEREMLARCRVVQTDEGAPLLITVGNSRLEQVSASIMEVAKEEGWTVVTLWKGGCVYTPHHRVDEECNRFIDAAHSYIRRASPDAIVLNTTFNHRDQGEDVLDGMKETLDELVDDGTHVIAMRDQPRLPADPPACIAEHGPESPECTPAMNQDLTHERPDAALLAELGPAVHPIDVNDLVCPQDVCTPVIGNVIVSLDDDHITGTYSRSMQDGVAARLQDAGFRW